MGPDRLVASLAESGPGALQPPAQPLADALGLTRLGQRAR